jgi:hypothetical protein
VHRQHGFAKVSEMLDYIRPNITIYDDFSKASNAIEKYGGSTFDVPSAASVEDILHEGNLLVVSEPGLGKSRLLSEVRRLAEQSGFKVLERNLNNATHITCLSYDLAAFAASAEADLSANLYVFLDSLDEVKGEKLDTICQSINSAAMDHPEIRFFVACRWHYYKACRLDLPRFKIAAVRPFSRADTQAYLSASGLDLKAHERLMESLMSTERSPVLTVPRYLELLVEYLSNIPSGKSPDNVTRAELFEHFVNKKLDLEDGRRRLRNKDISRRLVDKLSLVMAIRQSYSISKDDLVTFLEDIDSSTKLITLARPIGDLYDNTILKETDNFIEFDNAEFQEYMAAKELCRIGKTNQTIFDLAVSPFLREVYPKWYSVLSFVLELNNSSLIPLLELGERVSPVSVQNENYHKLIGNANTNGLGEKEHKQIFFLVYNYYKARSIWIDSDIAKDITRFTFPEQIKVITKDLFEKRPQTAVKLDNWCVSAGNAAMLISKHLGSAEIEHDGKLKIIQHLVKLSKDKNTNGVLQRNCLRALGTVGDDTIVSSIAPLVTSKDTAIGNAAITALGKLAPNSTISIDAYLQGVLKGLPQALYAVSKLKSSDTLCYMLGRMSNSKRLANMFCGYSQVFDNENREIGKNIANLGSPELLKAVEKFVLSLLEKRNLPLHRTPPMLSEIFRFIRDRNPSFVLSVVKKVARMRPGTNTAAWNLETLSSALLTRDVVPDFVRECGNLDIYDPGWVTYRILLSAKAILPDGEGVYEAGRTLLRYWYERPTGPDPSISSPSGGLSREYERFLALLGPEPGAVKYEVLEYYNKSFDRLSPSLTEVDKDNLIKIVTETLDSVDPEIADFHADTEALDGVSITMSPALFYMGDCIMVAEKLGIDLSNYRNKLVAYLPFATVESRKWLLNYLGNLSKAEVQKVISIYKIRSESLYYWSAGSIIEFIDNTRAQSGKDLLNDLIRDDNIMMSHRLHALEVINRLNASRDYLVGIFEMYKEASLELAELANQLLINNYEDADAVDWRFREVKRRAKIFVEKTGMHARSPLELEFSSVNFARPIAILRNDKYIRHFIDLLNYSFDLISKSKDYVPYAEYLWKVVKIYFLGLCQYKSYAPIQLLEKALIRNADKLGANWFTYWVEDIKFDYLNKIGQPETISESIKIYNEVKKRVYLNIATSDDLLQSLYETLTNDFRTWFLSEGQTFLKNFNETGVQQLMGIQVRSILLGKGFRYTDLVAEPQSLDGTKVDYLLSYGLLQPIIIEIKRRSHNDLKGSLKDKKSFASYADYLTKYGAHGGVFMIIDDKDKGSPDIVGWEKLLANVEGTYGSLKNTRVVGISSSTFAEDS